MKTKIVIWKDGTHVLVGDGLTQEYENDSNWLTTISINHCPFCGDSSEFDDTGLKYHLENYCPVYKSL